MSMRVLLSSLRNQQFLLNRNVYSASKLKLSSCISCINNGLNVRKISTSPQFFEIFKIQDSKDFENKVLKADKPVIVDFFATWCNPCKMLTPRIESVINENEGKIALAKVDIDELTEIALDYDVHSVPVLLVIKNGKIENKMVGLQDTDKIRNFVDQAIKK